MNAPPISEGMFMLDVARSEMVDPDTGVLADIVAAVF
jgi:hypothetical protein